MLSKKFKDLKAYVPGEQPMDKAYLKLNTNEAFAAPPKQAWDFAIEHLRELQLYPDPECRSLHKEIAKLYGVRESEVIAANGSDELLNFAFLAYGDEEHPFVFPDISYGFYEVFAKVNGIRFEKILLDDDFQIRVEDYCHIHKNIVIANPNAPTGIALGKSEIETILRTNPDNIVIIDEAYVDFGGESCLELIHTYKNLLVCRTFSKSRSAAGLRLGYGFACEERIRELHRIRYSINPYNVNSFSMSMGIGILREEAAVLEQIAITIENRDFLCRQMQQLGFWVLDSKANFLFAKHETMAGEELYQRLKMAGILVRHFSSERIREFIRITIGSREQMEHLVSQLKNILEDRYAQCKYHSKYQ